MLGHGGDLLQPALVTFAGAVLGIQSRAQHRPAAVHVAEAVPVRHAHVAVERDVGAVPVHGADRLDVDPGGVEGHQEHRQALMLGGARVGVRQQEHVMRMVGIGGEHLGSVDDPAVTVTHRAGLTGRDVGAALGFGESQAQSVVPGQRLGQHLVAQFVGAEVVHGVRHHRRRARPAGAWRGKRRC